MCKDKKQAKDLDKGKTSYDRELYNACKYIYGHQEEFKDFEIYKILKDRSLTYRESENSSRLHNILISQYRILIGEGKMEYSENSVEGFDIAPSIDISYLDSPKTLSHILVVFHHFANKGESRINQKRRLRKVDIDKSYEMMDYLVKKINSDATYCDSYSLFDDAHSRLKEGLKQESGEKYKLEERNTLVDYNRRIDFFTEKLTNDLHLYSYEVGKLSPTFQAWLYLDLCCWAIIQFVIVGIIRNRRVKNKLESIEKFNSEIVRLMQQEKEEKSPIKLDGSPEEITFKIFSYYHEKDRYLQDTETLECIEKNRGEWKIPSKEYSLIRFSPQGKDIQWQDIKNLFSEGESGKSLRSFKDSILKCHKGIFQFNEISDRNLKPEPITLRAFYKEIYMDDILYNSRKSMTIFHEFLEKKNMKNGDFYFIDEKINAGIFREYGQIEEFYAKNNLQRNLYCLVCYFLALLNPAEIINKFKGALDSISTVIGEIYNESSVAAELGACENPEEEEKFQLEIKNIINNQKEHVEELRNKDTKEILTWCFKLYNLKYPDGEL